MAKDFVTPEQYQRGVGKIKNYVDNNSNNLNESLILLKAESDLSFYGQPNSDYFKYELVKGSLKNNYIYSDPSYKRGITNGILYSFNFNSSKLLNNQNILFFIVEYIINKKKYRDFSYQHSQDLISTSIRDKENNVYITLQVRRNQEVASNGTLTKKEKSSVLEVIIWDETKYTGNVNLLNNLNLLVYTKTINFLPLSNNNGLDFKPTLDCDPATKKYVDDTANILVKKDTNKYVLITNDDTLIIKKDSITDIVDATVTIDNLTGQFGTLVANDDGTYSYTLNTIMTDVETFTFKVNNVEQKLVIVPYREMKYDDSNTAINYMDGWNIEKNEKCYNGNIHVVTSSDTVTSKANFEFVGTGIEVFSLINNQTGRIQVAIWKQKDDGTYPKTAIYRRTINTNYTYSDVAYAFPVISFDNNEYGKYKIEITVGKGETFYLDSICIHNPIYNLNLKIQNLYQPINENTNILYTNKHNPVFNPSRIYDPTTKKYVDDTVVFKKLSSILEPASDGQKMVNVEKFEDSKIYYFINDVNEGATTLIPIYLYKNGEKNNTIIIYPNDRFITMSYNASKNEFFSFSDMQSVKFNLVDKTREYNTNRSVTKKVSADQVLTKTNTTEFTPTSDYHPTTKKYVDDKVVGLATETYVDSKTSMENVIYEGNGTGPDVISDYWTGCPVVSGNGCWVINKQIEFDSSKPNPYYLLCDTTLYSPENSTFDKTNSAWIYPKVPNRGTIFICNKYNNENKLVLPWDDVNSPTKMKLYTKTELATAISDGDLEATSDEVKAMLINVLGGDYSGKKN